MIVTSDTPGEPIGAAKPGQRLREALFAIMVLDKKNAHEEPSRAIPLVPSLAERQL